MANLVRAVMITAGKSWWSKWEPKRMEMIENIEAQNTKGTSRRIMSMLEGKPVGRVLDAPAGHGPISKLLNDAGHSVTAVDLDNENFAAEGVLMVSADLNDPLPFQDGTFDYAVCADGIEHLENPFACIREFARVLKKDGLLIISTPNISAFRSRQRYLFSGFHNKGRKPMEEESPSLKHHISLLTFTQLRYGLHRFGLRIEEINTNRIKPAALYTAIYYPIVAAWTARVLFREKDPRQRVLNKEIYRQMLSWPVCMGETIILSSRKR